MSIDEHTIRDLIGFSDPRGVLSLYVGHTTPQAADPQPTAPLEIRSRSARLVAELAERDQDLARAVGDRLKRSERELALLLDPKAHGRGRALFIGVESGESTSVALQMPFRHRVVHHPTPYIRPLVAAHDEGRDAGVLVVSRSGMRLLRWAVGEAEEIGRRRFEVTHELLGSDMTGPSPANPQDHRQGHVHREQFEHRIDANHQRFLREVSGEVAQRAKSLGWDRLVLSGAPKVRSAVKELLNGNDSPRVVVADASWEDAAPHEIADNAWPLLRSIRQDRERELIEAARSRALAGGAGALGLRDVCDALNEGRVEHLLYDDSLHPSGFRSEEGTLHPDDHDPIAQSDVALHPEALLVERMVERAISTSAGVTPVGEESAPALEEHDGFAAVLRW